MNDHELSLEWDALRDAPERLSSLEAWRDPYARMKKIVAELEKRFRDADEAELAKARAHVAQLEARLNVKPPVSRAITTENPRRETNPIDETDFGQGIGGRGENLSASEFTEELHELRERGRAKRARLNG